MLATVVAAKKPKPGIDFFPLTVNYQEKYFAAGKIPGGYFKRERGPTETETLTSPPDRPPDPPAVPRWLPQRDPGGRQVLPHDMENDPDVLAMVAASAALTISGVPFMGPIGGARVGYVDGEYVLNPPIDEMPRLKLDLVVAGTQDAVLMVESEAQELTEEIMLGAVMFGHRHMQKVIEAIIKLAEQAAKEPRDFAPPDTRRVEKDMLGRHRGRPRAAYTIPTSSSASDAVVAPRRRRPRRTSSRTQGQRRIGRCCWSPACSTTSRPRSCAGTMLDTSTRIDGRDLDDRPPDRVRKSAFLPRTHGSALFTRGETQALVVATLGTGEDEQYIDAWKAPYKQRFMLHYNFPPYSVGETGRIGAPGRREIGHGKLAWRAIHPMLPTKEEFPYTIRVVSEITESNGSSSMATVCGTSLALMDAGVPLKRPVAGIAMGLILEGRALRRALRHPRRRGSPRRHGLQGRRHRATASPRCRWTSRSPASPRRS